MAGSSFSEYLSAANKREELSEREKAFIGLAVTMSRGCEPCSIGRIQRALNAGISRRDLEAAMDLIAAVNAGVVQAIARRGWEQVSTEEACTTCEPATR